MPSSKSLYERIKSGEVKVRLDGPNPFPPEYRFWAQVDKDGPTVYEHLGKCWLWTGKTKGTNSGHVTMIVNGKSVLIHRFSWGLHYGDIPDNKFVLHRCDNPRCTNPEHLFL